MVTTVRAERRAGWRPRRTGLALRLALCVVVALLVVVGGDLPPELRRRQAANPYAFRLLDWEIERLGERVGRIGAGLLGLHDGLDAAERRAIAAYFEAPPAAREPLRAPAEAAIEQALTEVLAAEGLGVAVPLAPDGQIIFPPVSFSFTSPPQLLAISRRDRIAVVQSELLRPDLTTAQAERIEAAVDRHDVSSLVVPIGGLATYPTMVLEHTRPRDALVSVAHEWIHGWLFFSPLGRAYFASQAAREINETATEIAARELGGRLARELDLAGPPPPARETAGADQPRPSGRDFRSLMRTTRIEVDRLLAEGRIADAEAYMRDRRDELAAAGFTIRKLNQAYFAFHGSYGDAAAGGSRIPGRLQRLREASPSVGAFLRRVAQITTADDLARAVGDA